MGASRMLNRRVGIKTAAEIGNWKNLALLQRYLHRSATRASSTENS
jgi:hypothetical protein